MSFAAPRRARGEHTLYDPLRLRLSFHCYPLPLLCLRTHAPLCSPRAPSSSRLPSLLLCAACVTAAQSPGSRPASRFTTVRGSSPACTAVGEASSFLLLLLCPPPPSFQCRLRGSGLAAFFSHATSPYSQAPPACPRLLPPLPPALLRPSLRRHQCADASCTVRSVQAWTKWAEQWSPAVMPSRVCRRWFFVLETALT